MSRFNILKKFTSINDWHSNGHGEIFKYDDTILDMESSDSNQRL